MLGHMVSNRDAIFYSFQIGILVYTFKTSVAAQMYMLETLEKALFLL